MEIAKQFLGSGYDVCGQYADPISVKKRIFDLQRVPDECKRNLDNRFAYYSSYDGNTVSEYQTKLSAKAKIGGTYQLFTGSVEASFDSSHINTKESSFITVELYQRYHTCKLQTDDHHYIYPDVLKDFDTREGEWLIDHYGGCVLMGIDIGGRWSDNLTVTKLLSKSTYEIKSKMEAAYTQFISAEVDNTLSVRKENKESIVVRKVRAIGGNPAHAPDNLTEWKKSVEKSLGLVDFTKDGLVPIWKIFPKHEEKLKRAFEKYVKSHQIQVKERKLLQVRFVNGHKCGSVDFADKLEVYEPPKDAQWKYVGHNGNNNKVLVVKETVEGYGAIRKPVGWQHVWNNRHRTGARFANLVSYFAIGNAIATLAVGYTSIWIPIAPPGYVPLGVFCRIDKLNGRNPPDDEESQGIVVVHESFVEKCATRGRLYERDESLYYKLSLGELPHNSLWTRQTDDPDAGRELPTPFTLIRSLTQ